MASLSLDWGRQDQDVWGRYWTLLDNLSDLSVLFADFLQNLSQPKSFSSAGDIQCDVCSRSFESLVGLQFIGGLLFS